MDGSRRAASTLRVAHLMQRLARELVPTVPERVDGSSARYTDIARRTLRSVLRGSSSLPCRNVLSRSKSDAPYFTAPKVNPRTNCFCVSQPSTMMGATASNEAAESLAQNRPSGLE